MSVAIPTDRSVNSLRVHLSRYAPRVTMVQTTETRHSYHGGIGYWPLLDGPLVRGVFGERVVHSVLMVVAYVFTHEPSLMCFVHHDDMVQNLPATTSHPSFRGSILPGGLDARPLRLQTRRFKNMMTSWSNFESRSRMT